MNVVERGLQTRGLTRAGSHRSGVIRFKKTWANVDLKPAKYGPALAVQTSMPKVIPQKDLSASAASRSEDLDNSRGLQVWSRTCYTYVK
jgi:hypothetical protein